MCIVSHTEIALLDQITNKAIFNELTEKYNFQFSTIWILIQKFCFFLIALSILLSVDQLLPLFMIV